MHIFKKTWIICVLLPISVLLSSCGTIGLHTEKELFEVKSAKEKELVELRESFNQKLVSVTKDLEDLRKQALDARDAQEQKAVNALYGQSLVFKSILVPTRTDLINQNLSEEAWAALGGKAPDYKGMQEMNERIARELNESVTSLADLKKNHEIVMAENKKLTEHTKEIDKKIKDAETERTNLKEEYSKTVEKLQNALNIANDKVIAYEKKKGDDSAARIAARNKMFVKISSVCGIAALACFAVAIYLPAFKKESAIFGALCGAIALGIWYLTPTIVAWIGGSIALGLLAWVAYKHEKESAKKDQEIAAKDKVNTALVLSLQTYKEKYADQWPQIADIVAEQTKKYVEKDGKITTEEDKELTLMIDKKLAEYERK